MLLTCVFFLQQNKYSGKAGQKDDSGEGNDDLLITVMMHAKHSVDLFRSKRPDYTRIFERCERDTHEMRLE